MTGNGYSSGEETDGLPPTISSNPTTPTGFRVVVGDFCVVVDGSIEESSQKLQELLDSAKMDQWYRLECFCVCESGYLNCTLVEQGLDEVEGIGYKDGVFIVNVTMSTN